MIETKILGDAPGVQNQGLIDKTESTSLPTMTNAVIVGRFKRGRMDKPFKVMASDYQALLGYDPSNPSYLAIEDLFVLGVDQIYIVRTGSLGEGITRYSYLDLPIPLTDLDTGDYVPSPL